MAQFQEGDLVVLKSGSPPMTVTNVEENKGTKTFVSCCFFSKSEQEFNEAKFPESALKKANP